jgi:hypothetical protein
MDRIGLERNELESDAKCGASAMPLQTTVELRQSASDAVRVPNCAGCDFLFFAVSNTTDGQAQRC